MRKRAIISKERSMKHVSSRYLGEWLTFGKMKTNRQKKILFRLLLLPKSLSPGFVLLGAILLFTSCSSKLIVKSQPQQEEMIIDGSLDDWSQLTFTQLKQDGLAIGVKNDRDHLYICMRIFDQAKASAVMRAGFTVWLDASVSKKKTCGIRFPLGMPLRSIANHSVSNRRGSTSFERDSVSRQSNTNTLEIIDKGQENKQISIHNPYGIDVAIAPEPTSGALVYELAVPITAPVVKILSFQARPGEMVGIGLEVGTLATAGSSGSQMQMPMGISLGLGGMGFGMGGMGGGMYGGMYPGRGMMNTGKSTPSTTWVYATLANSN
jgi:hypothetical protein